MSAGEIDAGSLIEQALDRVVIRKGAVEIWGLAQDGAEPPQPVTLPWTPVPSRRKRAIILPAGVTEDPRPIRAETRARLVEGIAKARRWLDELTTGSVTDTAQIARREGCSERSVRMTLKSRVSLAGDHESSRRGEAASRCRDNPSRRHAFLLAVPDERALSTGGRERQTLNQRVQGSSPCAPTKLFKDLGGLRSQGSRLLVLLRFFLGLAARKATDDATSSSHAC